VRADLKQIFASQNVPVVYVTHDRIEAMTLSTKVAVLDDGYVRQLDTPANIYDRPANLFVAGFVGSPQMNLVTLACQDRHAILGDVKIPLPERLAIAPPQIVMGIRPERVELASATDLQVLRGRVVLVENLGMHDLASVQIANSQGGSIVLRALIPADRSWHPEAIAIAIAPAYIHWFDVATGDAL
jgi:multiple sugar transport system ATP-binding protein